MTNDGSGDAPNGTAAESPAKALRPSAAGATHASSASPHVPAATFEDLLRVMRTLLGEGGCEWDRAQTPASLLPYLVEEAYEVREAVMAENDAALVEELGDLALHVAFQSLLAEGRGAFRPADVFAAIVGKMVRRHPHVFGERAGAGDASPDGAPVTVRAPTPDASPAAAGAPLPWEELKRREREARTGGSAERVSLMEGIPLALPALLKAQRVQERAAGVGFDWNDLRGPLEKIREELAEVEGRLEGGGAALAEEIGDLLFAVVNLARRAGVPSEEALDAATAKFRRRFARLEELAAERGLRLAGLELDELDALWNTVKLQER